MPFTLTMVVQPPCCCSRTYLLTRSLTSCGFASCLFGRERREGQNHDEWTLVLLWTDENTLWPSISAAILHLTMAFVRSFLPAWYGPYWALFKRKGERDLLVKLHSVRRKRVEDHRDLKEGRLKMAIVAWLTCDEDFYDDWIFASAWLLS